MEPKDVVESGIVKHENIEMLLTESAILFLDKRLGSSNGRLSAIFGSEKLADGGAFWITDSDVVCRAFLLLITSTSSTATNARFSRTQSPTSRFPSEGSTQALIQAPVWWNGDAFAQVGGKVGQDVRTERQETMK